MELVDRTDIHYNSDLMVTFAFKVDAPGFFSWLIRFVTKSQDGISHVEVIFPCGRSFSSREPKGVYWDVVNYLQHKWIFCDVKITPEQHKAMLELAAKLDGAPYDFLGCYRLYKVKSVENMRQFCSEVGGRFAHTIGLVPRMDHNLIGPQRLYDGIANHPAVTVRKNWETK